MEERRDAVGRVVHQPVLDGGSAVAQHVRVAGLLHGELREVADAVGYQLAALRRVESAVLTEEFVHIHTLELGDTLFLRHLGIQLIYLLFDVDSRATTGHQCTCAHQDRFV